MDEGDPVAWIASDDAGVSSMTIWGVMMNLPTRADRFFNSPPFDPSDFGRCYRLLKVMPSWRARLAEVSKKFPQWEPFVRSWDELTSLYEAELPSGKCPNLYKLMEKLRDEDCDTAYQDTLPTAADVRGILND